MAVAEKSLVAGVSKGNLALGRIVRPGGGTEGNGFPAIVCHDPTLQPHLEKPWLKAWIARDLGLPLFDGQPSSVYQNSVAQNSMSQMASALEADLAHHCLILGTSGSGKSRVAQLLFGQLLQRGYSLFAIEPKMATIRQIAAQAQAAGLAPEQITIVSPSAPGGAPGWNPFFDRPLARRKRR